MSTDPIDEAAEAVRRGSLVVMPTDTVYGIGTRPDDPEAIGALFEAKGRPYHLTLPVLVAGAQEARSVALLDERAERLASALWPGAVTLVLPRTPHSAAWDLGEAATTIAVRVPSHPLTLALLARTGPMAVTSANRSGEPPARTCDELTAAFGDLVAVYLCRDDEPLEGTASTVVDLTGSQARLIRRGACAPAVIDGLLGSEGPLLDSGTLP